MIKSIFPAGTWIKLILLMNWHNGRTLSVLIGKIEIRKLILHEFDSEKINKMIEDEFDILTN